MEGVRVSVWNEQPQLCVTQSSITGEGRGRKDVGGCGSICSLGNGEREMEYGATESRGGGGEKEEGDVVRVDE